MGFGWLTRLGSPFLKIFWADISKNFDFFRSEPETAPMRGESALELRLTKPLHYNRDGSAAETAASSTVGERRESLDRVCCSGLLVRHAA